MLGEVMTATDLVAADEVGVVGFQVERRDDPPGADLGAGAGCVAFQQVDDPPGGCVSSRLGPAALEPVGREEDVCREYVLAGGRQ